MKNISLRELPSRRVFKSALKAASTAFFLFLPALAFANGFNWSPTSGTDFSTPANWLENAVPQAGDIAFDNDYGNPNHALMSITNDQTVDAMRVNNGNSVSQTGGAFTIANNFDNGLWIGQFGTGFYAISGGTLQINDPTQGLLIGVNGSGDEGAMTISGSASVIYTAGDTVLGYNGKGTWNQEGGAFTGANFILAQNSSSGYTRFNLDGGTFSVLSVSKGAGTGTNFYFNGGTLQARASTDTFMQGLDNVQVRNGGAIIDSNGHDVSVAQTLLHSTQGDGPTDGGLTKNGSGNLTISGTNTYTGATQVNAGSLFVNGDNGGAAGAVGVASGTVLGGIGTVGGATTVNAGGTITAAAVGAVGTLTLNSTVILNGTYAADVLSGTGSDRLAIAGSLTIGDGSTLTVSGTTDGTSTYDLANYASVSGAFTNVTLPDGYALQYNLTELDLVPVPEPATWLGALLLAGAVGFSQRRRLRN